MKLIKKVNKQPASKTPKSTPEYTDLRQIMDYTKPFEIIYSGVENESYYDILYDQGIRNFLMSYHYIQTKHLNMNRFDGTKVRLFIDSGAHTYQNDPKYADMTVEYWEQHLVKYLKWVERNRDYIFAIASFDFENLVGGELVDEWNRKYFEPFMLRTGIPVCFVWHQNSYHDWDYYCKRYPYVGFSSVNTEGVAIDLSEYKEKLRVAERNEALVHGFGMTRTNMLTELPFYTSDSTTWLVGLQYGEVNYWTKANKMSRLKKDKWKSTYLDEICSRYSLDPSLMEAEDTTELIKANIGAFMDAEVFIKTRLKSMMYWLKAKAHKVDLDNLPDDFFPEPEWFGGDCSDAQDYARKMNINPEHPQVVDILYDTTAFLNWDNPEYEDMKNWYFEPKQEGLIDQLHDDYINRIVPDIDAKVEDLIKFFSECVSGENDKLLQLGTNFDRTVKERENYVEDDEEELVDISKEEVQNRLKSLLPAPSDGESEEGAPEVDSLDEEVYREVGVVPTFDSKGHFVKGQVAVRKPKKVYSKKYPKFACDTCYAASKCPEYKPGYVCAYQKMFNRFDTRDMGDIIQALQGMADHNLARMQRSMVMEVINGTVDPQVSAFIDQNMRILSMLKQMYEFGSPEVLRQTKVVRADGSHEETTQITNPQSGGILEKLFGTLAKDEAKKEEDLETIDAETVEPEKKKNPRYEVEEDQ